MKLNTKTRLIGAALACGVGAVVLPALAQETLTAPPTEAADVTLPPDAPMGAALPEGSALLPEAAEFKAALQTELVTLTADERAAIDGYYAQREYAPFWTEPGSDRPGVLAAALGTSAAQALPPARYQSDALALLFEATPDPAAAAAREVAAMRAYLRYASDLSAGVLVPSRVNPNISMRPVRPAAADLLARLAAAPVGDVLAGLMPSDPDYGRLVAEKARLEGLANGASWGPGVPDGPTIHPGESSPRVAALRGRLARLGYVQPTGEILGSNYDDGLKQAVEQFQRDNGLTDDGAVGSLTLDAVNAPIEHRLAQVSVNLERMRWTNTDPGQRYLLVNIPDFTVTLFTDGAATWTSKVVVGKTHVTETPEFSGVMRTMVVNPTWHIPDSIAIRDYLPKLQRDPMVLKRQNIRLLTRGGTEINPKLVDFTQYTPENFPFRIKRRPSDDNALGEVKFLFPNEFSVYMHDTPHHELFARDVRAFSNGCIRLQKPVELAHIVLTGQVPDSAATYQSLRVTGKEHAVALQRPIPVHIVYRTVTFDSAGAVRYRPDVYGRDAEIFRALETAGVTLPAAQG